MRKDSTPFKLLADIEANMYSPFWFPDSKRIGFTVGKWGAKLHWVDADPNAKAKEMNHRFFALLRFVGLQMGNEQLSAGRWKKTDIEGPVSRWCAGQKSGSVLMMRRSLGGRAQWLPDNEHIVGTSGLGHHNGVAEVDVAVVNVDTQEVQRLTDDGQSVFVFWHDCSRLQWSLRGSYQRLGVQSKRQVIDANK